MKHIIDMFDSIDIQVAYVLSEVMIDRLTEGFGSSVVNKLENQYTYAQALDKKIFFNLYLSIDHIHELSSCPTTFFPRPECEEKTEWVVPYQTEVKMWEQVK